MSDQNSPEPPEKKRASSNAASYRWPFTFVSIAVVILIGYIATLRVGRDVIETTANSATQVADGVKAIVDRFSRENITETFISQIPEITSTGSGNLELVSLEAPETFIRKSQKAVMFVALGDTVSEIRVPVTYRYHLKLSDPWELDIEGNSCIVKAPAIRPSLPPAVHTDEMEKKSEEGWLRFDGAERMNELEKLITPRAALNSFKPERIDLVREECRKVVANFVRDWLLKEDQWSTDRFASITVVFPDETTHLFDEPTLDIDAEMRDKVAPVL